MPITLVECSHWTIVSPDRGHINANFCVEYTKSWKWCIKHMQKAGFSLKTSQTTRGKWSWKAHEYCERKALIVCEQHFSILLNCLVVVKVLLKCAIRFLILFVHISKSFAQFLVYVVHISSNASATTALKFVLFHERQVYNNSNSHGRYHIHAGTVNMHNAHGSAQSYTTWFIKIFYHVHIFAKLCKWRGKIFCPKRDCKILFKLSRTIHNKTMMFGWISNFLWGWRWGRGEVKVGFQWEQMQYCMP